MKCPMDDPEVLELTEDCCDCKDCELIQHCHHDCDPGEECQGCYLARMEAEEARFEAMKEGGYL